MEVTKSSNTSMLNCGFVLLACLACAVISDAANDHRTPPVAIRTGFGPASMQQMEQGLNKLHSENGMERERTSKLPRREIATWNLNNWGDEPGSLSGRCCVESAGFLGPASCQMEWGSGSGLVGAFSWCTNGELQKDTQVCAQKVLGTKVCQGHDRSGNPSVWTGYQAMCSDFQRLAPHRQVDYLWKSVQSSQFSSMLDILNWLLAEREGIWMEDCEVPLYAKEGKDMLGKKWSIRDSISKYRYDPRIPDCIDTADRAMQLVAKNGRGTDHEEWSNAISYFKQQQHLTGTVVGQLDKCAEAITKLWDSNGRVGYRFEDATIAFIGTCYETGLVSLLGWKMHNQDVNQGNCFSLRWGLQQSTPSNQPSGRVMPDQVREAYTKPSWGSARRFGCLDKPVYVPAPMPGFDEIAKRKGARTEKVEGAKAQEGSCAVQ